MWFYNLHCKLVHLYSLCIFVVIVILLMRCVSSLRTFITNKSSDNPSWQREKREGKEENKFWLQPCLHQHFPIALSHTKHTRMSSSYSSQDWVLSHWAHFTVRRFICVYLCIFCMFLFYIVLYCIVVVLL